MQSFFLALRAFISLPYIGGLAPRTLPASNQPCDCFQTVSNAIYENEILIDFRNGKPTNFDSWFSPLDTKTYQAGPQNNIMSPSQVTFSSNYMTLLASRKGGKQYSAEVDSNDLVLHGSFRARYAIVGGGTGGEGGVSGFFTFKEGGGNELDIEILTSDQKPQAQYSTHIKDRDEGDNPNYTADLGLPLDQMMTHRFDWEPNAVKFWVDGKDQGNLTDGVPQDPSTVILNMWSSGVSSFGGSMKEGGESHMNVEWFQGFYNTTESGKGCKNTCYVG